MGLCQICQHNKTQHWSISRRFLRGFPSEAMNILLEKLAPQLTALLEYFNLHKYFSMHSYSPSSSNASFKCKHLALHPFILCCQTQCSLLFINTWMMIYGCSCCKPIFGGFRDPRKPP